MAHKVLIVDDDSDIRTFVEISLSLAGFETVEAADGEEGVRQALAENPDIVVMDVMMPRLDGFEALRRIRADGRLGHIPVILLTAKTQTMDKLQGFDAGADDYLTKPFDPSELIARIQATLRRAADMRAIQPLTGLPGNVSIDKEVERRVRSGEAFALLHADLNNFKAYNDYYGYSRGDDVIGEFAAICVAAARRHGGPETFVGHVGGDDFVLLTGPDQWDDLARQICEGFDALAPTFYDDADRAAGGIRVKDRQGAEQWYPLVGVSIGVAVSTVREFDHPEEAVSIANELKSFAKQQVVEGGSNYAADRRRDDEE